MLGWIFGAPCENVVHLHRADCATGIVRFDRARVRWFLSINARDLPRGLKAAQRTYRSITVDGEELEFSEGFTNLHTVS